VFTRMLRKKGRTDGSAHPQFQPLSSYFKCENISALSDLVFQCFSCTFSNRQTKIVAIIHICCWYWWNCWPSLFTNVHSSVHLLYLMWSYSAKQHLTRFHNYKRQTLLTLREHIGSLPGFGGIHVAHICSFLCFVLCFVVFLSPVSCTLGTTNVHCCVH
jgi:hypothetical protein